MKGNSYFIKVGDTRVRISTINSYSLVEYSHISNESERYKIKIVTSRTSFLVPVKNKAEAETILKGIDDIFVFNIE